MTKVPWYRTIRWKLFLSYLLLIVIGILLFGLGVRYLASAFIGIHAGEMGQMLPVPPPGDSPFDGPPRGRRMLMHSAGELMVRAVDSALFWSMCVSLAVALILSFYFSRRISGPVLEMAESTEGIANGDFTRRSSSHSRDELGVLSDSLNRMAERLERTEEQRRRLIGDLAHELRTPLTGVSGYMEGMIDGVMAVDPENLRDVQRQAERLTRLVEEMQRLSRLQEGQEELRLERVDACEILRRTVGRMQAHAAEAGLELSLSVPEEAALVMADPDRIEQVLINLISNAVIHSPERGHVTVSIGHPPSADERAQTDGKIVICVADEGPGIPEEAREAIFERFYRGDPSRTRSSGTGSSRISSGSGLGLTIARHIVEAHGGTIWVDGPSGGGSVFCFSIPCA